MDGGIEITASHNSAEYNGFKICRGKDTLYGDKIQEIRAQDGAKEFREKAGGKSRRLSISCRVSSMLACRRAAIGAAIKSRARCRQWRRRAGGAGDFSQLGCRSLEDSLYA